MNEASYYSMLAHDIESKIGGKITKLADKSTLGLPDSIHVKDSIVTWIETKIGIGAEIISSLIYTRPWNVVKKDLRQFEVCKRMSKHSLVLYAIYYPIARVSAIVTINQLEALRSNPDGFFVHKDYVKLGRGLEQIRMLMNHNREEIY